VPGHMIAVINVTFSLISISLFSVCNLVKIYYMTVDSVGHGRERKISNDNSATDKFGEEFRARLILFVRTIGLTLVIGTFSRSLVGR